MFHAANMAIGAGPLYTNALMGQTLSAAEREAARKASSSILRQDFISIEESSNPSRPDSFSVHYDCTSQAPYFRGEDIEMMTQHSLLHLPPENPSHDLAFFLRTTGPTQPHRRPSRLEAPGRAASVKRRGLRFLKPRRTPSVTSSGVTHQRSLSSGFSKLFKSGNNDAEIDFFDEGGLLAEKPVEQKTSMDGTKYLALKVKEKKENDPRIMESRVSVLMVPDDPDPSPDGNASTKHKPHPRPPTPATELAHYVSTEDEPSRRPQRWCTPQPQRLPAVSRPSTPEPVSAISVTYSFWSETEGLTAKPSFEHEQAPSYNIFQAKRGASASLPNVLQVCNPSPEEEAGPAVRFTEMRHPTPVRFASHPVLSQTNASIASAMSNRSASYSPGPPPRSPLRLRRAGQAVEGAQATQSEPKKTTRTAPSILSFDEYNHNESPVIRPTVVTDCTGPIKRPKSRGKDPYSPAKARKEREERMRARKLRDRPMPTRTIDAVVKASPPQPRQKLRKARPHIQIPKLQTTPQTTRASSSTSSNASWKKVTESTRTPVSAVPSADVTSISEKTTITPISPISPTTSHGSRKDHMTMSPVMLVAEELPLSNASKPAPRPAKVTVMKDGKPYVPRPRSASIPNHVRRRSRQGVRTPTRPVTPTESARPEAEGLPALAVSPPHTEFDESEPGPILASPSPRGDYQAQRIVSLPASTEGYRGGRILPPPLPSPPPTCALPPIPLASVSTMRPAGASKQSIPPPPSSPMIRSDQQHLRPPLLQAHPSNTMSNIRAAPHVAAKYQRKPVPTPTSTSQPSTSHAAPVSAPGTSSTRNTTDDLYARVEALERKNAALLDQLNTMIITGGGLYGRPSMDLARPRAPMVWESRIARRGAASRFEPAGGKEGYDIYWGPGGKR